MAWWRRRARVADPGVCAACGHIWREHLGGGLLEPGERVCGECRYEVEHGERPAGNECEAAAP